MIVVLLVSLIAFAAASPASRIVGGTEAVAHSHPFIASLQSGSYHMCSCCLIDRRWCLTAAHCVDGARPSDLRVQLGEHSLIATEDGEQSFGVSRIVSHPDYNGNAVGVPNDIALLELDGAANITDTVDVAKLTPPNASFEGNDVIIAGWGTTGSGSLADKLQEVWMTKISNEECAEKWSGNSGAAINDRHTCVFDHDMKASTCNGDSGGPMIGQNSGEDLLIGLTSWGIADCGGNYPSVYTRVSKFLDWIQSHTGPLVF